MEASPTRSVRYRLAVNHLTDRRLPLEELTAAARGGLQDSSPRSGLLSLHARVEGIGAESWRDPRLVQVFGPRGAVYLVPRADLAVFTLGVFPADERHAARIRADAAAVRRVLEGGPVPQREVLRRLPELGGTRALRWAGTTGALLPVWDAVDTMVVAGPEIDVDPAAARLELTRRFFRFLGPASVRDLQWFLETTAPEARSLVERLGPELHRLEERLIAADTVDLWRDPPESRPMLLLPPEDPAINRRTTRTDLPERAARRLWPRGPAPGAVVADGRVVGTWRRVGRHVTITPWVPLTPDQARRADALVEGLPLPKGGPARTTIAEPVAPAR